MSVPCDGSLERRLYATHTVSLPDDNKACTLITVFLHLCEPAVRGRGYGLRLCYILQHSLKFKYEIIDSILSEVNRGSRRVSGVADGGESREALPEA